MSIRLRHHLVPIGLIIFTAACSALTPYRLPIQQGNIVSSEALAKLQSGMSKNQAAQILGTPLLNDIFHSNQWDYVHYLRKRGTMSEKNHVVLVFEEEKLARLAGEGAPVLAPIAEQEMPAATPKVKEPTETK